MFFFHLFLLFATSIIMAFFEEYFNFVTVYSVYYLRLLLRCLVFG